MTDEQGVKRYDCTSGGAQFCNGCYQMEEDEMGDYVRWEDYERLRAALARIADGDPNRAYSPLGALHAAGMVMQWEADAKVAREALGGSDV